MLNPHSGGGRSLSPLWLVMFSLVLELRLELKNAWIRVGAQGRS